MNENLKFNIRRLKQDFENVIDELVTEIGSLEEEIKNSFSEAYVNDLEEEIDELKDKLNDKDSEIENLKAQLNEPSKNI